MEVNSGASFEQYFLWTPLEQIAHSVRMLEQAGLAEVAELTREAVRIAFPSGLPASDFDKETQAVRWDENQIKKMHELAKTFTRYNARIEKTVKDYAHKTKT